MLNKFIAAVLSTLVISLLGTFLNYNPVLADSDFYYSFGRQFFVGSLVILAIYIFFLIPLTIIVDGYVYRKIKTSGIERQLAIIFGYALVPLFLGFHSIFTHC